jgi:hypothetical protein
MGGETAREPDLRFSDVAPMSPEQESQMRRRLAMLLGLVPLPEMSQDETNWVFRQHQRLADDA